MLVEWIKKRVNSPLDFVIHSILSLQQLCSVVTIITSVLLMSKPRLRVDVWFSQDPTVMSGSAQKWSHISVRLKSIRHDALWNYLSPAHKKIAAGKIGHNYLWDLFTKRWLFLIEARTMNETLEDCCKCLWPEQSDQIRSDQSLSHVRHFVTPWIAVR